MDKLWAPWRETYITSGKDKKRPFTFSRIAKEKDKDKENHVFIRNKYCFAVLNLYPYNNGHSLVVPYRRVADMEKLKEEELFEIMKTIIEVKGLLTKVMKPHGFNVGVNLGKGAGAGIPQHIHFHVVPRWSGDNNFMPVIGQTKVISQSLDALYEGLVDAYKKRNRRTRK